MTEGLYLISFNIIQPLHCTVCRNISLAYGFCNLVRSACAVACGKTAVNACLHISVNNNASLFNFKFIQEHIGGNSLFDEKHTVNIKLCSVCKLNARHLAVTDNRSDS